MLSKRELKKSYYVWFLGAQEARVARGVRPALAALHRLERRAHDLEPFKVTLQVSPKGLKIVQNVDGRAKGGRGGRSHTVKHFLPADSVTEVVTRGDAVVCVLLLYNPVTRCPLHAHAYRCDSEQTAQALCAQLRSVAGLGPEEEEEAEVSPPEEIEPHLQSQQDARLAPEQEVVADKLAAELRKRLAGREPLLLPPRDYDTSRKAPRKTTKGVIGSSAGSSGIGSDLAPSPDRPHTSSEEDWTEGTAYMMHEGYDGMARRARSPSPVKSPARKTVSAERTIARNERAAGSVSPKDRFNVAKEKFMNLEREKLSDEFDKRAQMRRNLNNILSRGPKTPAEMQSNRRSNAQWPSEEDLVAERRPEVPRPVTRDQRNYRDSRERDFRDYRGSKEPLDMRELKDVHPMRDSDYRDYQNNRKNHENRKFDYKESKDVKYLREYREADELIETRERAPPLEQRYYEYRGERNDKYFDNRYKHDSRSDDEGVESEKQFDEIRYVPRRRDPEPKKDARAELLEERQRQMEASRDSRAWEPKKDTREWENKRDPREWDVKREWEGKRESRDYEPKRESRDWEPKRESRDYDARRDSREWDKRDNREWEPKRDTREWEAVRRSYAEAERPRRDPRTRHSYAEPVARTRVGMATVAPF